jgi:hypothetical protein
LSLDGARGLPGNPGQPCEPALAHQAFVRGDCNSDFAVDLSDAVHNLSYLLSGGDTPSCIQACDSNGDDRNDISDPIYILNYLFLGSTAPPAPFPACDPGPAGSSLSCALSTCADMDQLLPAFRSPSQEAADAAYARLYQRGVEAIGPLLGLAQADGGRSEYGGSAYHSELSSIIGGGRPPVSLVALYLTDAIVAGQRQPYLTALLLSADEQPRTPEELLDLALGEYIEWWELNQGRTVLELRLGIHPLFQSSVKWYGPRGQAPQQARPNGRERPNSETPYTPGTGTSSGPYSQDFPPVGGHGRAYNCLAWAVGCFTNTWIEPPLGNATSDDWKTILSDNGYDTANPVSCDNPCAAGKGPKIKMVFHVDPNNPDFPRDENWQHAMKQEGDGDWSSKNGSGSMWDDITDCADFLKTHYAPPPGKTLVTECFCK